MSRSHAVFGLMVLLASSVSAGTLANPVVGGTMVPPGTWPDAVAILGPQGSCTGTLIAPDVVLTAGHCKGIQPTEVVANTTNYNGAGGQRVAIASFQAYPEYQHTFDVAVIVLAEPIVVVAPRAVGTSCSYAAFADETLVHLVGFGLTQQDGGGANTSLREAMAPVLDAACTGGNGCRTGAFPSGEFVAGGGVGDSCFGDSGGPVYLDTPRGAVVIAAVSRGLDDSATPCGGGGIYVRTDKVIAWIEETTGRTIAKDSCVDELASPDGQDLDDTGGCSASGGAGGALVILIVLGAGVSRRRRVR